MERWPALTAKREREREIKRTREKVLGKRETDRRKRKTAETKR